MINILTTNHSARNQNSPSLPQLTMFSMVDALVDCREKLLSEARNTDTISIIQGNNSSVYDSVKSTIPSSYPSRCSTKNSLSKILADCWFVFNKITTMNNFTFTRSFDLRKFIGNVSEIQDFAQNIVDKRHSKVQSLKSVPLSSQERKRGYLLDGGEKPGFEFQFCVRCNHNLIDFPPTNAVIREENEIANKEYMKISSHLKEFNDGICSNPPKDTNGKEIKKISAPTFKQELLACKCFKNKGFNCIFKCFYNGKQYPYNNCPICKCVCQHLTTFNNYFKAVYHREMVKLAGITKSTNEEAKEFVDRGVRANYLVTSAAAKSYQNQIDNHRISGSYCISLVVQEQGYLAQAKTLITNPPSFSVKQQYRQEIERYNKAGRTMIDIDGEIQDVRTMGKATNAAAKRRQNNKLSLQRVVVNSGTGQPKNDEDYVTPTNDCEEFDNSIIVALAEVPDPFETLGKRIRKKIRKARNDVTPGTEAAHHGILGDMAAKNKTAAMQVLEDAATGDDSDFENSQELLNYMTKMKKKDLDLK